MTARRRPGTAPAPPLGAALLVLGAACSSPDLYVQNLRALHEPDGSTRFVAHLVDPIEWGFEFTAREVLGGGADAEMEPGEVVEDPYGETLENLLALASFDPRAPRSAGLQVEMYSWLGVDDPYVLARERCVIELAGHARRLGLRDASRFAPDPAPARPAEVAAALEDLQVQVYPALIGEAPPGGRAGLRAACEAVLALPLDREAGRRALAFCNIVLTLQRGTPPPEVVATCEPFYDLHIELQRRLVSQALAEALDDPHAVVRGAALRAVYALPDSDRGALVLAAMESGDRDVGAAVLRAVADHGLPSGPPPAAFGESEWIDALIGLAYGFDGLVSAAACRALAANTEGARPSLRPEDWTRWRSQGGAAAPPPASP